MSKDWRSKVDNFNRQRREASSFDRANLKAVEDCLKGGPATRPGVQGVRAVVNIPAVHIPSFCDRSLNGISPAYLNAYDLDGQKMRLGDIPTVSKNRDEVDQALRHVHKRLPAEIYFAAVELNGTGVRFYGDVCLVIAPAHIAPSTVVLDRNSYDLLREPFKGEIAKKPERKRAQARVDILDAISGKWDSDTALMAAIKIVGTDNPRDRRLTTGQISDGLLNDEDYMEILKVRSFTSKHLEATRLSLADVVTEDQIERDYATGQLAPDHTAVLWSQQRKKAISALRKSGVCVNVARTTGRTKI